jgi:methylmalonyl-CoA mutase C-terminal domain/subunit
MEVIYTPPWQEMPDVVKLAHGGGRGRDRHLFAGHRSPDRAPKLMAALREAGLGDVCVVVGGIVPDEDEQMLLEAGVARVFHPGATMDEITRWVHQAAGRVRAQRDSAP